jgi:hypothetical protein
MRLGLEIRGQGEADFVTGHDFNRIANWQKRAKALASEGIRVGTN